MSKIRVLLVYGGQSSEHDVSLMSARNVFAALDDNKYDVIPCLIDKDGHWWLQHEITDHHAGHPQLLPVFGQRKFITLPNHHVIQPDIIFPVLHGKNGEDGTIQGFAELMGLPYVGPSLLGAAVTMDKDMTKRLLEYADIPVVPWRTWRIQNKRPEYKEISQALGNDVFVKPASAGSSVGVGRVKSEDDWNLVLEEAANHSELVLIEKAIDAREIELAVLGNNEPKVTAAGEIQLGDSFYSYDEKYADSSSASTKIPADLDEAVIAKLKQFALEAYKITECRGMARVDFFIEKDTGSIYLNEINTIPGFTNISMYPKLWQHEGVKYAELVDRLIQLALE